MKRLSTIMMCLFAMMAASLSAKAQEVTITLYPGWNWISYPKAEVLDINTALGDFVPVNGDMIKAQFSTSSYINGYWRGGVTHFMPGWGYMYYSNRTEVVSFVFGTPAPQLIVTTAEPTEITANSATCGGNVSSGDGNYVFVLLRGICWGTTPNPTFNDNYVEVGNGIGSFTTLVTELTPNTTYYVRAFAVTESGTFYGDEKNLHTIPIGAINGIFSVSDMQQVYFSKGNLQYIGSASNPYWKFADNQWDYFGYNGQNSNSATVDRDLFGWGTSGWDNGNTYYHPWDIDYSDGSLYGPLGNCDLTDTYVNSDWGVYNPISNGGNTINQWRTLTQQEWQYLFYSRITASGIRYVKAKVNGISGLILLPDNWDENVYSLSYTNQSHASFNSNEISITQWTTLENAGAIFLPCAGYRTGTSISYSGDSGYYWSSTSTNNTGAYFSFFYWDAVGANYGLYYDRYYGRSVRLVQNVR